MNPSDQLALIQKNIREYGTHVQGVDATEPGETPWAYTIGLHAEHGLPDVIVSGLPFGLASHLLNLIAEQLTDKRIVLPRDLNTDVNDVLEEFPVRLRRVDPGQLAGHVSFALLHGRKFSPGRQPEYVQLVMPDAAGRFPGEPGVDTKWSQKTLPLHLPPAGLLPENPQA